MRSRRLWLTALFLFVVGDAIVLQTRGPLLRSFEAEFHLSESLLGLVAPAGTIGFLAAVLFFGALAGRLELTRWLVVGAGGTVGFLWAMSLAPGYALFLLFLVGQGTAVGIVRGLDRPLLSHLYPARRGLMFNLHALAWAAGAVLGPILVNQILARAAWQVTYLVMGAFFLPIALVLWRVDVPTRVTTERGLTLDAFRQLIRRPIVLGMAIGLTLLGSVEGIIFTWLPFYASTFMPLEQANLLLAIYLFAYLPGRGVFSWLVDGRVSALSLALVSSALAIPSLYLTLSGVTGVGLFLLVAVTGFFNSGLFPLISTFGVNAAPEYSGPISALGIGGAYLGLAIAPVGVGILAEFVGIVPTMLLAVVLAGGICLTLAVTTLVTG